MKVPGPDHPITIEPNPMRVVVTYRGQTVADTVRALTLREAGLPPVHYVPREDADMALLERTDHTTHCPYKGDAAYYDITSGSDETAPNAVWTYESPNPAVAAIEGHLAFTPAKVDGIEERAV